MVEAQGIDNRGISTEWDINMSDVYVNVYVCLELFVISLRASNWSYWSYSLSGNTNVKVILRRRVSLTKFH